MSYSVRWTRAVDAPTRGAWWRVARWHREGCNSHAAVLCCVEGSDLSFRANLSPARRHAAGRGTSLNRSRPLAGADPRGVARTPRTPHRAVGPRRAPRSAATLRVLTRCAAHAGVSRAASHDFSWVASSLRAKACAYSALRRRGRRPVPCRNTLHRRPSNRWSGRGRVPQVSTRATVSRAFIPAPKRAIASRCRSSSP
jgi:hypothetical protein